MYERLLEPNCADLLTCTCGVEMRLVNNRMNSRDADVKDFACSVCGRELHLMVWPEAVLAHFLRHTVP